MKYNLSGIMKMGHTFAKKKYINDTYKKRFSKGLKKAWQVAKGLLQFEEVNTLVNIAERFKSDLTLVSKLENSFIPILANAKTYISSMS